MIIKVGSENSIKIEAVRRALSNYNLFKNASIEGSKTESNVSEQPFSLEETIQGAINRAEKAFRNCDYSVGLESGIILTSLWKDKRYFEHTICSIYDGHRHSLGFSPAFELPQEIMKLINSGMNLEEATKELGLTNNSRIGRAEGIIGILTHGKSTRIDYTKQAIMMAMIPYQNLELYA